MLAHVCFTEEILQSSEKAKTHSQTKAEKSNTITSDLKILIIARFHGCLQTGALSKICILVWYAMQQLSF